MKKIRVGTRGSRLARLQTELVLQHLKQEWTEVTFEAVVIQSTGDRIKDLPLDQIGGSGIFTSALEEALQRGEIDLAVHSMKDLPVCQPEGLIARPYMHRADPRDALIFSYPVSGISTMPIGARIGTGSLRRTVQLKALRPDLEVVSIRGNVDTRLGKVGTELDGVILAASGLIRADFEDRITVLIPPDEMIPAPAQGILALEHRKDDLIISEILSRVESKETIWISQAERALLLACGAGCHAPIGAYGVYHSGQITLSGLYGEDGGNKYVAGSKSGAAENATVIGFDLGEELLLRYKEKYG